MSLIYKARNATVRIAVSPRVTRFRLGQLIRNQQVVGSNPTGGSKKSSKHKALKIHFSGHSVDLLRIVRKMSEFVKFHSKRLRRALAFNACSIGSFAWTCDRCRSITIWSSRASPARWLLRHSGASIQALNFLANCRPFHSITPRLSSTNYVIRLMIFLP